MTVRSIAYMWDSEAVHFPEGGVHRCPEYCTSARVKPHRAVRSKQQLPIPQPHMLAQQGDQVVQPAVLDRLGGVADNLRVVELDALAKTSIPASS